MEEVSINEGLIDTALYIGYALLAIGVIAMIVLPLINALNNPKALVRSVVGVGIVAVIYGVGYALADGTITPSIANEGVNESTSRMVGGAIMAMWIFLALAVLAAVYSEVSKIFR